MQAAKPKRHKLCQFEIPGDCGASFKEYLKRANQTDYLTFDKHTEEYQQFVDALFYKTIVLYDSNLTSWFCRSCFCFSFGSKTNHLGLGHPKEHMMSVSSIKKELGLDVSSKRFATFLQSEAKKAAKQGLNVEEFSLPSIERRHEAEERRCCKQLQRQVEELREQSQSLLSENLKLERKVSKLKDRLRWARLFSCGGYCELLKPSKHKHRLD